MPPITKLTRYLPLIIGLLILCIILIAAPWNEIVHLLHDVSPLLFLALFGLSMLYYGTKAVRFWYILRLLGIKARLKPVILLYLSGQPFSILPVGELYRTVLLKKHLGVRISASSPSVTIQGLVEAIVLLAIALFGAFLIGRNVIAISIIGALLLLLIIALQRGWLGKSHPLLNKLPFVSISQPKFQAFIKSHQELLAPRSLTVLVAFSLIPVLAGISILYLSSEAIGQHVSYVQAMVGYSLPVIVSGMSLLPGGLGVSEGGTIGILHLFGVPTAAAITITLLVRIFSLVAGIVFGTIAQLILHTRKTAL